MKKQLIQLSVVCLVLVLIIQCCFIISADVVFAETTTDSYIVITNNDAAAQKVKDQHEVNSESGEAISVNLSEQEAKQLEADKDILCVEKDFTIEDETEAGWDMVKPVMDDWNLKAINADNAAINSVVKVAIIDSGIDYTEDILVKARHNFISDDPVTTPLYEDTCGHGTSVASIIAGKGIESAVSGVNGNIELYSARVLDNNKRAPISRVVEAIYWAMEKDVNIINMSFGTKTYSAALKAAIDVATEKGILVIASAGNYGNTSIDYPAAFDNVLAVGSINATGEISDFSSTNDAVDLLAPGESVFAQANFGEGLTLSGTSLSASHVTGVAACLWSKDLKKPSTFIKVLLKLSAKEMSGAGSGYGLVDYERALQIYDEISEQFDTISDANTNPPDKQNSSAKEPLNEEEVPNNDSSENLSEESPEVNEPASDNREVDVAVAQAVSDNTGVDDMAESGGDQGNSNKTTPSPDTPTTEEEANPQVIGDINSTEFEERAIQKIQIENNNSVTIDYSDPIVTGSWGATVHQAHYANMAMKNGASYADHHTFLKGIQAHPEFHGFAWHNDSGGTLGTGDCNFMANYRYLIKVANAYGNGDGYTSVTRSEVDGLSSSCFSAMQAGFSNLLDHERKDNADYKTCDWCNGVKRILDVSDTAQKAFVMGLAMHVATDTFAHSAFKQQLSGSYPWVRITHTGGAADDVTVFPKRVQMAYAVEKNVVSRYNEKRGNYHTCNDFYNTASGAYTGLTFRITKMRTFAEAAGYNTTSVLGDFGRLQNP